MFALGKSTKQIENKKIYLLQTNDEGNQCGGFGWFIVEFLFQLRLEIHSRLPNKVPPKFLPLRDWKIDRLLVVLLIYIYIRFFAKSFTYYIEAIWSLVTIKLTLFITGNFWFLDKYKSSKKSLWKDKSKKYCVTTVANHISIKKLTPIIQ